jgi:threonine aldolase
MTAPIDLRSDTVTIPGPEMRKAMAAAEVGDDVFGEDPTVNRLQETAAAMLGQQAGLFVPSGTMANLLAVLSHCRRGDEAIVGDQAHIVHSERGGASALAGVAIRTVPNAPDGTLPLSGIRAAVRDPGDVHQPPTGLICVENTQNRCGGAVLGPGYMRELRALADELKLPLHLDGARVFNAAIALGVPVSELTGPADSVYLCLSKGLGAPVGSLLLGSKALIATARHWRKALGGGMRQAGVIAAAGLWALDHMVERLADDHANARALAEALAEVPGLALAQETVSTNIVLVDVSGLGLSAKEACARFKAAGVLASPFGATIVRFVTHDGIGRADVLEAARRIGKA